MVPPKMSSFNKQNIKAVPRKGITTRSQNAIINVAIRQTNNSKELRTKRKAEASPLKDKLTKRSALGNITNAFGKSLTTQNHAQKKSLTQVKPLIESNIVLEKPALKVGNVTTKPKPAGRIRSVVRKSDEKVGVTNKTSNIRHSFDPERSEDNSLYVSALEDVTDSVNKPRKSINKVGEDMLKDDIKIVKTEEPASTVTEEVLTNIKPINPISKNLLPSTIVWDFDADNWLDPYQVSHYAMDIFTYLKNREPTFPIGDYMDMQNCLSQWMRALLVDWMVEVQESFELNHETLYLAVKLVDLYLTKIPVQKENLQLLGAGSLFIASKFDERIPPMVEDFLYICDGAYKQKDLLTMEMNILKVIDFDLGIPLSYRFLRRYARCAKVSMPTLTLARYILEYSLMDYSLIKIRDSKIAAAALLLALLMKDLGGWNATLEYYSGYNLEDIRDICNLLNESLHKKHREALMTVRNKYSHKIFFEVAKLPLKEILDI